MYKHPSSNYTWSYKKKKKKKKKNWSGHTPGGICWDSTVQKWQLKKQKTQNYITGADKT